MSGAIGIIGGSGLYDLEGINRIGFRRVETPFGDPSDEFLEAELDGRRVFFLPRHGRGHRISPSEINFRANIFGMKKLGVERILSVSAVGSMKMEIKAGDFVIVDQFFDRTRHRPDTFFGDGIVAHVMFADPFCEETRETVYRAAERLEIPAHWGGTYICMEGPQFSTRAESNIYRSWGVDVIGMTNLQEAKLAREAEICYATIAMATDYDCWHEEEESVSVEAVIAVLHSNIEKVKALLRAAVPALPEARSCPCVSALQSAILTDKKQIPPEKVEALSPLLRKYF